MRAHRPLTMTLVALLAIPGVAACGDSPGRRSDNQPGITAAAAQQAPKKAPPALKLSGKRITLQACDGSGACNEKLSIGVPVGWKEAPTIAAMRRQSVAAYGEKAALLGGTSLVRSDTSASDKAPSPSIFISAGSGDDYGLKVNNRNLSCQDIAAKARDVLPGIRMTNERATIAAAPACVAVGDLSRGNKAAEALGSTTAGPTASRMLMILHDQSVYSLSASEAGDGLSRTTLDALDAVRRSWRWE